MNKHQFQGLSQHRLPRIENIQGKHDGVTTLASSDQAAALLDV